MARACGSRPRLAVGVGASWLLCLGLVQGAWRLSFPPLARRCAGELLWIGSLLQSAREAQAANDTSEPQSTTPDSESQSQGESQSQSQGESQSQSQSQGEGQSDEDPEEASGRSSRAGQSGTRSERRGGGTTRSGTGSVKAANASARAAPAAAAPATTKPALPSLVVSADLVRSAAAPKNRPVGVFVAEQAGHPCGIEIRSVGLLAGRIRPGDILVEVEGQPIRGWPVLVGTVTRAYQRRAEAVRGRLWRNGLVMGVTVHIPYEAPAP